MKVFWFRRDLRLEDNNALFQALKLGEEVLPVFIFDKKILNDLPKKDRRIEFIYKNLLAINDQLSKFNASILCINSTVVEAFAEICSKFEITEVYTNHDYEPSAIKRDEEVRSFFKSKNISFYSYKDQVIFEKSEIVKSDSLPYTVYTPYSKKWKEKLSEENLKSFPSENFIDNFHKQKFDFPSLDSLGFEETNYHFPTKNIDFLNLKDYDTTRDFPIMDSGSKLSVHLRFGTISIRFLVKNALKTNATWLSELIWREFFMQILYHFPHVVYSSFRPAYDTINWRNNEAEFEKWCNGETGYPIVDAGMRELNETGNMHNRVRMIVASFLCKHLLIDWRWGEAYFAEKLNDYELSANNGNWQWSAGSGCDAAPYFRVFNPTIQTQKFDKDLLYIKKWVKNLNELDYPQPIVEHAFARDRALFAYKKALKD